MSKKIQTWFHCVLLVLISFFSAQAKANGFWEFGYKRGIWFNPGNLNDLIRDYNKVNPTAKFHTVHGAQGGKITLNAEIFPDDDDGGYFITGLQWMRNVQTTTYQDPTLNKPEYRHLIVHYGGIFIGFKKVVSENFNFGFEAAGFNYFVMRYQTSSKNAFGMKGLPEKNTDIVNDYNPDFGLFAQWTGWMDNDFLGISLMAKLDLPIYGPNELDMLRRTWNLNTQLRSNKMRGFNFNLTAALMVGSAPDI